MISTFRCGKCIYLSDLSGYGAYKYGGRWNSKGNYLLYTASNPSLALLECVVHMTPLIPGISFCMVTIDVGATSMLTITPGELKPGWDTDKGLEYCKGIGDQFIKDAKFLMLKVPSAILPIEWNILINPKHPLIKEVSLTKNTPIAIDPRLKSPS